MKYRIFLDKNAQKQFKNLDIEYRDHIKGKIVKLKNGFVPELDIKKLKGFKNYYRLRVGKYRILFELQEGPSIVIYDILPRKKAYKK